MAEHARPDPLTTPEPQPEPAPSGDAPAVSVVIPFRDRGALLAQTCASLRRQTLPSWEGILVNDGSQPDTRAVASQLTTEDRRFRLIDVGTDRHVPGPWLARNLGIAASRAPLIAFLDADDLWHPNKLTLQLRLHQGQGADLSVSAYLRFRSTNHGEVVVERRTPPPELTYHQLLAGNVLPLSSVMVRRELLQTAASGTCGPFRAERHEDYGLWLRLFARCPDLRYARLADPLMAYRLHPGSLSAQRWRSHQAVSALLAQHSRNRLEHALLLARWGFCRVRERWPHPGSGRIPCRAALPAAYLQPMAP